MKSLLRKSILSAVLLLSVAGVCAFFFADRALDGLVRPWLERQAGQALDGEVRIGRLTLQGGLLAIDALAVETATGLTVSVPRIEVEFSFASLLQHRLEAVRIKAPRLKLEVPQQDNTNEASQGLPSRPALSIDRLVLSDGEALVSFGERQVQLHGVELQGALSEFMPFQVSALVGEGQDNPLLVRGEARWDEVFALSLQELSWQQRSLLKAPVELELQTGGEVKGGGAFQLESLDDRKLIELFAALGMESPLPAEFGFELRAPVVSVALVKEGLKVGLTVERGQLRQVETRVVFEKMQVELRGQGDDWQGSGSLLGPAATAVSFRAGYAAGQMSGTALVEVIDPVLLLQELSGSEPVGIAGSLQIATDFSWRDGALAVKSQLRGHDPAVAVNDYKLNLAPLNGSFSWQQDVGQPGRFDLALLAGKSPLLSASGGLDQIKFSSASFDRQRLAIFLNPTLLPEALDVIMGMTASGTLRGDNKGDWRGDLQLAARQLGAAGIVAKELSVRWHLDYNNGKVTFSKGMLAAALTRGDELSSQLSGRFRSSLAGQKYVLTLEQLALDNVEYIAADGMSGLGGGAVELRGRISGKLDGAGPELDLAGTLKAGEVLAGAFYADLSGLPGQFSLAGELTTGDTTFKVRELKIEVPGLGELGGSGRLSPEAVTFAGSLQMADLAASYGSHLGPVLVEMLPTLEGLRLAGALTVDYQLRWSPFGAQVAGEVGLKGLKAAWPKLQLDMADGNGSLPFVLSMGDAPLDAAMFAERHGALMFAALAVGPALLEDGRLQLAATPNSFSFLSPLVFRMADGRVAIKDLTFGLGDTGPQGSLHIAVQDVDLEALTKELALPVMRGGITADLGELRYADQELSSEGVAEIDVFSGRFQMRNMRYLEPFSPYPVLMADVDFAGLDLYQATNTFDFGEMNGVVDGYIHGLRLFGTTPSAFEARLESRGKGKRNISVKALNNLSILSQGGIQAALSRGVYRFIDFYRYRKIGLFCTLDNDKFVLKGTAVDDSSKTLVDGGMIPPRIDIVTSASIISFKEMVRRISRIKRAGK